MIHSEDTQEFRHLIEQISEMEPPLLNPTYSTMKEEILAKFNHHKPLLSDEERVAYELQGPQDPYEIPLFARWLYNIYLIEREERKLKEEIEEVLTKLKAIEMEQDEMDIIQRVRALESVRVVAMTTTGAAKYKDILRKVNSQIMIV